MAGDKNDKAKLNNTLLFLIKLLNANNIKDWFIGYGTLLGIVRENSCINGDDDIDIIISNKHYDVVKKLLIDSNLTLESDGWSFETRGIIKTHPTPEYCSIDFYIAEIDAQGNFIDPWEKVIWSNCYNHENSLVEYIWNGEKLYLPFNFETKLLNRYGEDWRTPMDTKGPIPRKEII
jgi:hypothetical protein